MQNRILQIMWLCLPALLIALPCGADSKAASDIPRVFLLDADVIVKNKQRLGQSDPELAIAFRTLIKQADKLLQVGPFSVMDKRAIPPSGDKHDYQSIGPYWWPDPDTSDGLPYIRKDGKVNPERAKSGDAQRYKMMREAVTTLSYAWYFSGEEKYAAHAAKLVRTWYLNPATRMNPNMQHAQAIPGRTEGRGIGIVDAHGQPKLIDAIGLLQSSEAWTDDDQKSMVQWFDELLNWLLTSRHGQDEANTKNNHATQYDVQVASYALFVGKPEIARKVLEDVRAKRIGTQIEPDGSQPHELKRTLSWNYSTVNTLNFTRLAVLAEHIDIDLWQQSGGEPGIRRAIDYLLPYATGNEQWEHKQIKPFDGKNLLVPLLYASEYDQTGRYKDAAKQLLQKNAVERLLFPMP